MSLKVMVGISFDTKNLLIIQPNSPRLYIHIPTDLGKMKNDKRWITQVFC